MGVLFCASGTMLVFSYLGLIGPGANPISKLGALKGFCMGMIGCLLVAFKWQAWTRLFEGGEKPFGEWLAFDGIAALVRLMGYAFIVYVALALVFAWTSEGVDWGSLGFMGLMGLLMLATGDLVDALDQHGKS